MKPLSFLLLLACLLNNALSQPTGTYFGGQATGLAHNPDPNTVDPGSFPATAVSQSADSTLEAATEVSFPAVAPVLPVLPFDLVLKIVSHADIMTKCFLRTTSKRLKDAKPLSSWSSAELADIEKIKLKRYPYDQAFYQAILKEDTHSVKSLYLHQYWKSRIYGLELAVRYNSRQAAWIMLACAALEEIPNDVKDEFEKHRIDAERKQCEPGLGLLAQIKHGRFMRDGHILEYLILNKQGYAYCRFDRGAAKGARILGLQIAVQCGTNMNILMWLAFGTWDWDMDSKAIKEIVVAAKGKLPQTHLDFLKNIQDSAPEKQDLWKDIVSRYKVLPQTVWAIVSDDDTAILGMQLAVMSERKSTGSMLLLCAKPNLREKLIHAAEALVTSADKCENLQENWDQIKEKYDSRKLYRTLSSIFRCLSWCYPYQLCRRKFL